MASDEDIERRALELQAQGPDEFPFGYYKYLATLELTTLGEETDE